MNLFIADREKPPPRWRWKIYSLVSYVLVGIILANAGITAMGRAYWGILGLVIIIDLSSFIHQGERPCTGCKLYRELVKDIVAKGKA